MLNAGSPAMHGASGFFNFKRCKVVPLVSRQSRREEIAINSRDKIRAAIRAIEADLTAQDTKIVEAE